MLPPDRKANSLLQQYRICFDNDLGLSARSALPDEAMGVARFAASREAACESGLCKGPPVRWQDVRYHLSTGMTHT